ncbi:MAG: deoxyribose-phosphate aldolase [Acidobacteriia bacterium]|nr:deoxyribose-phosphate aldolase [Terriglobia bacterium]
MTPQPLQPAAVARLIDHTLLRADALPAEIEKLCREALHYSFAAVCVNSVYVPLVARLLRGSSPAVCSVAGFPLGAMLAEAKLREAELALAAGACEIDMVIHVGALKAGEDAAVAADIRGIAGVCRSAGALCKVILETALLTDEEKRRACLLARDAGAAFVKTSTGFGPGGATPADVRLLRETVGPAMGVKASGGVRSLDDLLQMVAAGATRIGASAGVKIVEEARTRYAAAGGPR